MKQTVYMKYRILPDPDQIQYLNRQFGANRFVWNQFLEKTKALYETEKKFPGLKTLNEWLMELKAEHSWLYETGSQALQQIYRDFQEALQCAVKKIAQFPRFKSRKTVRTGTRYPQYTSYNYSGNEYGSTLSIPKCKDIKIIFHRPPPETYRSVTITREARDIYYACFVTDVELPDPVHDPEREYIGIDIGLKTALSLSTGEKIDMPLPFHRAMRRMAALQKAWGAKKKGSRAFRRLRYRINRLHRRIAYIRKDAIRQTASRLVKRLTLHQTYAMETFSSKALVENCNIAPVNRRVLDIAPGAIIDALKWSCLKIGRHLVQTAQYYASTRICNPCHVNSGPIDLKRREWACPHCKTKHDRDINAAKNIARYAERKYHGITPYDDSRKIAA